MADRRKPNAGSTNRTSREIPEDEEEDDEEELDEEESSEEEEDLGTEDNEEEDEDEDPAVELARLRSNIQKLRASERKSKADRKRLATAEAELQKYKDEQLTAEERTKKDAQEAKVRAERAEARLQELSRKDAIYREARRQGAVDEEAVYRLIDLDDLEEDEDGEIENAKEVVTALLKKKSYLLREEGDGNGRRRIPNTPDTRARGGPSRAEVEKKEREELLKTGRYN